MPLLLNQFDLRPEVERACFDAAWSAFTAHLVETGLAAGAGPILTRHPDSGYDTDDARGHALLALIHFCDHAQADAAWAAIEADDRPLGLLHRRVIAMVRDPVFTFWDGGLGARGVPICLSDEGSHWVPQSHD